MSAPIYNNYIAAELKVTMYHLQKQILILIIAFSTFASYFTRYAHPYVMLWTTLWGDNNMAIDICCDTVMQYICHYSTYSNKELWTNYSQHVAHAEEFISFIRDGCWELACLWSLLQIWNKVSYGNVFDCTLASREKGNWTSIKVTHLFPANFTGFYNTTKIYNVLCTVVKLYRLYRENKTKIDLNGIKNLTTYCNSLTLRW